MKFEIQTLLRMSSRMLCALAASGGSLALADVESSFRTDVQPLIQQYCSDCHADGANKGGVTLDEFKTPDELADPQIWWRVLKNVRAGIMPPPKKPQPTPTQKHQLETWIKSQVFAEDPQNPDPGRITVRRLNRAEYRNTIRDLLGVEFEAEKHFPPDDSGHGFDNIGDVLTLSPMLLEKYLAAAKSVVAKAVPMASRVPAEAIVRGREFRGTTNSSSGSAISLLYYTNSAVTNLYEAEHPGRYQLLVDLTANERFVDNQFDYNKCQLVFRADGKELLKQEFTREGNRPFHFEFEQAWDSGERELSFELTPLTLDQKQVRSLTLRIDSVTIRGPLEKEFWVRPKNYKKFFAKEPPGDPEKRRAYARTILADFVERAYRHPVEAETVDRLVELAVAAYSQSGKTFEEGIGQGMTAVLASPRFLFREESASPGTAGVSEHYPQVDEFSLASRLSYFIWSSMPDEQLIDLAGKTMLRKNLAEQTKRMLEDPKAEEFVRNFVGQWLETRDIDSISIDARQVLGRESAPDPAFERQRQRFRELRDKPEASLTPEEKKEIEEVRDTFRRRFGGPVRAELNTELRRALRQETEKTFEHVMREDRSLLELLSSDYTFLNERLANHYGLTNLNVRGDEMRLVKLPRDSARGGVLTQGSVLAVTSNPTRTSPVKRGLFVLNNLLGAPPPPPPPDIPPLEDAVKGKAERTFTLRENLALHREKPLCSSCHNRMDPLGLALENFNALGMWRDQERGQPIDASGTLLSGESFTNILELKRTLVANHSADFYRTVTEKLLTYALGRGLEYYDTQTVDQIVERLEKSNGRSSVLLEGVINSAAFQKTRSTRPENRPIALRDGRADASASTRRQHE